MKRFLLCLTAVALFVCMASGPAASAEARKYIMATGSVGGTFYPLGAAIASIISKYSPGVEVSTRSTGASTENCRLLGTKQTELGLAGGGIAMYAYQGKEMFKEAYPNLRAIGFIYPDVAQWVTLGDSKINSIQDFKGKRIGVGPVGSGCESTSRLLLEHAGMSYNDIKPVMLPFAQSAENLKDGHLDAADFFLAVPNASVMDLATMHKIRMIEVKGDFRKSFQQKHSFYIDITIPKGTYKGIDQDVETIGFASCLFTRDDIPDEDVYKMTKALFEHSAEIAQIHQAGQWITLESAKKGIFIPFHPGAAKYFKEKGVKVDQ